MRAVYMLAFGGVVPMLWACGGSPAVVADAGLTDDAGLAGDAGDDADLAVYPAIKPDMPRVITGGGPVLKKGSVTPVYFPGFDYVAEMTDFSKKIGATKYWAALAEYGVGQLTMGTPVLLTQEQIARFLSLMLRCMKPGGRIAILGPNYRYCGPTYFDCADHINEYFKNK